MGLLEDLIVPVNPDFDWDADPSTQTEYVNPVRVNAHVMRQHNAAIRVAQELVAVNKHIGQLRRDLSEAKDDLEDFEQQILLDFPPPGTATKSTKLTNAYIRQTAFTHNRRDRYLELLTRVRDLERTLLVIEVRADTARFVFQTIKLTGEHAQTHLSFVKNEQKHSRYGA